MKEKSWRGGARIWRRLGSEYDHYSGDRLDINPRERTVVPEGTFPEICRRHEHSRNYAEGDMVPPRVVDLVTTLVLTAAPVGDTEHGSLVAAGSRDRANVQIIIMMKTRNVCVVGVFSVIPSILDAIQHRSVCRGNSAGDTQE